MAEKLVHEHNESVDFHYSIARISNSESSSAGSLDIGSYLSSIPVLFLFARCNKILNRIISNNIIGMPQI